MHGRREKQLSALFCFFLAIAEPLVLCADTDMTRLHADILTYWELSTLYVVSDDTTVNFVPYVSGIVHCPRDQFIRVVPPILSATGDNGVFVTAYNHELLASVTSENPLLLSTAPWFVPYSSDIKQLKLQLNSLIFFYEVLSSGNIVIFEAYSIKGGEVLVCEIGTWDLDHGVNLKVLLFYSTNYTIVYVVDNHDIINYLSLIL